MNDLLEGTSGLLLGVAAALISTLIVFGSFFLALREGGTPVALIPSPAFTPSPTRGYTSTPPATPLPGAPTFTASPLPTETPLPTATQTVPSVSTTCPPPAGWTTGTVELGDTLASLASRYGVTSEQMAAANCMVVITSQLVAETTINVPLPTELPPTATATATRTPRPSATPYPTSPPYTCSSPPSSWVPYRIQRGDNLYRISLKFQVGQSLLRYYNCIANPNRIRAGDIIYVPYRATSTPEVTDTPRPTSPPPTAPPTNTATSPPSTATPTATPTFTATFTETPAQTDTPIPVPTDTPPPPTTEPPPPPTTELPPPPTTEPPPTTVAPVVTTPPPAP